MRERTTRRAADRAERKRLRKVHREHEHLLALCQERPDLVAAINLPDDLPDEVRSSAIDVAMGLQANRVTTYQPNAATARRYGLDRGI